jgi:hypothetical protein
MDGPTLRLMPLLFQAAAVMGQRSFNVSMKVFLAQVDFARAVVPFPSGSHRSEATGADALLDRVDSTRAHLRRIAEIVAQEARGLEADFAAISDRARAVVEREGEGHTYRRRWKAKR